MVIHVFNKLFDSIPTLKYMKGMRLLPMGNAKNEKSELKFNLSSLMELSKKKHYPRAHLTYVGNTPALS